MKRGMSFLFALLFSMSITQIAWAGNPHRSVDQLRKEVSSFFKTRDLSFLHDPVEMVSVSFLINPKNELVILDVVGDDPKACTYVRDVLNFKKVDYMQAKQLTRYVVDVRLVR